MPLTPGTRLGPYDVTAQIGVGGMGEVYRATDTNLKRAVALKVLPASLAGDAERLARFQREAEVLASLNHPNIAQIYGLEKAGGISALVMELVEGPTLADRIAQGAVPVDEVLPIAKQIAEALEAAHELGIVHRDLKPANVKVRTDGMVKVLDFGLAKALDAGGAGSVGSAGGFGSSMAPTITSPAMPFDFRSGHPEQGRGVMTGAGVILGTAAYMAPEQARGRIVDKRADVWAFGVVLYELVTGERLFKGDDLTETLASVVKDQPDVSKAPPGVQRLLKKCLEKDPRKRLRDIGDAWELLEDGTPIAMAPAAAPRWRRALPWALAGSLAVTGLALWVVPRGDRPPARAATRLELNLPAGVELFTLAGNTVAVSPDGTRIAFIGVLGGVRQVYVRSLDGFEAVPLRGTDNASTCSYSPDGRSIAFTTADAILRRVSLADGLVSTIVADVGFEGHAWGLDDRIVFVRAGTLWQVSASGGTPTQLMTPDAGPQGRLYAWPALLPGSEAILFAAVDRTSGDARIEAVVLATGEKRVLVERGTFPRYVPSGHLVFYRDGELLAAPFDVAGLRVIGSSIRVIDALPEASAGTPLADVSGSGTLVYAPTTATSRLVWVSRQGAEQPMIDTLRPYANPRLASNGSRVLVQAGDLWIQDLARATFTRLTSGETIGGGGFPVWVANDRIVFRTATGLRALGVDGGTPEVIAGTTSNDYPGSVSPDGERLLFVRIASESSGDIYIASLRGDPRIAPVLKTPEYEGSARLSPDGRWLAYSSNDSGRMEVYLRPFPGPDRKWQVSTEGGTQPVWNPNGRELFYRNGSRMMAVAVSAGAEPMLSPPQLLFEQRYAFGSGITIANYDVSPDGQRFVMVKEDSSASRLNVVLNWFEELQRLVPTP